jgi:2-iminobutanoate/2-iminopropanoate deaminase
MSPRDRKGQIMPRHIVETNAAPSSPLYSQGVLAGGLLFVSGTTGLDPRTGQMAGSTIQEQTRQALTNCEAILQAAGLSRDDIAEIRILLADPADFAGMNEEYARWIPNNAPARYAAQLGAKIPGVLISIRMTAAAT